MEIEPLIESLAALNWQAIIAIFAVVWFFTRDTRKSLESLDQSVKTLTQEVKSIHSDLKTMNTRIGRIEGTVYGHQIYQVLDKE